MRALIMAAGLGTRLRPLTDSLPKPLVPVNGRPMVEYVLEALAKGGISEAVINIHYLPEQMREFVAEWNANGGRPRLEIQDESGLILDSGGGVRKASTWLFSDEPAALVCNSDVLGSPDLRELIACHQKLRRAHGVECTLAVTQHPEAGVKFTGLRRDGDLLTSFERPGHHDPAFWLFPGYYVIEHTALRGMPAAGTPLPIADKIWKPLAAARKLGAWSYPGPYYDLGTVADLRHAEAALGKK